MWNEGYTSEVDYTSGYYQELSPERIRLSLLAAGIDHSIAREPEYLELGFGQGLSLAINAATNAGRYWGNDFNPGQVANARELAAAAGRPIAVLEDSFEELARRDDLPDFDIIALHGIWSWISDSGRAAIVEIARKRLKPGGALYISHNVMPAWAPLMPLRMMMTEFAKREANGQLMGRVDSAMQFLGKLAEANAGYFVNNPRAQAHFDKIKGHDRRYLAHEYFNEEWHVMPFVRVAEQLAEAKLTWATSATILDTLPGLNAPASAAEILGSLSDPLMREQTRDFFINQMFRRDLFVKGARKLAGPDQVRRIDQMRFMLLGDPANRPTKVPSPAGEAELKPEIYEPVVAALAAAPDCTASIAQIGAACSGLGRIQVWQAMLLLTGMAYAAPVTSSATAQADEAAAKALNKFLLARADAGVGVEHIAAPRIGGGIALSRIEQMLMRAIKAGDKNPVEAVRKMLMSMGQMLVVEGKTIEGEDDTRAELNKIYNEFHLRREDLLKRVGAW
jgi:SAM-dependent methyltransferase